MQHKGENAAASVHTEPPIPLLRRYPALGRIPRVALCKLPTPVQPMDSLSSGLWVKREDLDADSLGGNKVRALEYLLGGLAPGERIVTVGAAGSTHALATVIHARRIGARPLVYRWSQEMNDVARRVSARIGELTGSEVYRTVVGAYARALAARMQGARWIPAGGSSVLGILGQVNAGLELADQVHSGMLPLPDRIVVPLGTGGTAAGLTLGFAIAGLKTHVVGIRVVPRLVANRIRVRRLIESTSRFMDRLTSEAIPRPATDSFSIEHAYYGGAYGRATAAGEEIARRSLELAELAIDPTYGAKALAAAVAIAGLAGGTTLFWLSFDGRWLVDNPVA
jgi:D-cysteine desulfhydrase